MRRRSGRNVKSSPDRTPSESPKKPLRQSSRRRKRSSSRSNAESEDDSKAKLKELPQQENTETDKISGGSQNDASQSPATEAVIESTVIGKTEETEPSVEGTPPIKNDVQEPEEGTEEKEEKTKGKSKGKTKSNIEQSSNNTEPEIERENVQGTAQSPSNDNADSENVQNVNDAANAEVDRRDNNDGNEEGEKERRVESEANFESEYAQQGASENVEQDSEIVQGKSEESNEIDTSKCLSDGPGPEERSTTPEIKRSEEDIQKSLRRKSSDEGVKEKPDSIESTSSKRKITLRRSPPEHKESDKPEEKSARKETKPTGDESGRETEEQEEKPRKKITLKRPNLETRISNEDKEDVKADGETSVGRRQSAGELPAEEKKRRLSSSCEDKAEDAAEKPKKTLRKVKLIRNPSRGTDDNPDESAKPSSVQRRRKWNNSDWFDRLTSSFYKIDVDAIKIVCPSLNFLGEDEVRLEEVSRPEGDLRRKMSIDDDRPAYEKQTSAESVSELDTNIIAMNRKISIVDDTASKLKPPPSPAKNPPSDVLYITNLVRPFTVKQLRELLERTGKIVEDGFWTDRIKSKCYVRYESVEEAEATRNALHGVHWPIGNGKQLVIDFATVEDLEKASKPAPAPKPVVDKVPEKENREPEKAEDMFKEREREKEEKRRRDGPVREWDLGKEEPRRPHSRSRSRSRERARKHSRRSYTPEDYAHRKQRKVEEPVPQKLMDDLFLKTKATPSIYWQPLSPEEIATKQKQRLVRMEEHKRRIEETRVRLRENRRGSFRRR